MKRNLLGLILFLAFLALLTAFTDKPGEEMKGREVELARVAKAIDSTIGWAKEKDLALLFSTIAHDPNYLSVHPSNNVVRGFKQLKANSSFWMSTDFKYVRHEIKDLTIRLSRSGDVAWFYCKLNDINEWKGQPANWENTRWTGVLEKREGKWVMVQQHFSFASDS